MGALPNRASGVLAAAVLALSVPASTAASPHGRHARGPLTFNGTCQGSGTVAFTPPLTNTPRPTKQRVRGGATCSGTVVDRRGRSHSISDAPVGYRAIEQGDSMSCGAGIDAGAGELRFRWGALHFTVSEKRGAALATLAYTGARGGSATGVAVAGGDPATVVQRCGGSGLKKASASLGLSALSGISG